MEQVPRGEDQVQAEAQDADVVQVEAQDVVQAKAWVEWAALVQEPAQVDNVYVRRAALPSRIRPACPVITSVALNAELK
jgi:hypothetical protein